MDSNRTQLSYVLESAFGEVPTTPGLQILRVTGEDLKATKATVVSAEIRADRQISDLAKVSSGAAGGFKFELSYGSFSALFAAALGCTPVVVNQAVSLSLDESSETLTLDTAVKASGTLTSDNTNVADGATVTIGSKVYTFKTALTPTEGEVLIGADADGSLLNLIRAINHSGTPNTDYKCAAANTQVTAAASVTAHHFAVTAIDAGVAGNSIASTETSAHLSWGSATLTGGSGAWAVTPVAGQFLAVSGFTTPANNGVKRVVSVTPTVITFAADSFTVDEPTVAGAKIVGTAYKNGVLLPTFTLERKVLNAAGDDFYQRYTGMGVDDFNLSITTAKINEGSFTFMGSHGLTDNDPVSGATYGAATTTQVLNATSHVGSLFRDGVVTTEHVMGFDFACKANLRSKNEIGRDGAFELGLGEFSVTGKVNAYFQDNALYAAMIAHTYTSLAIILTDDDGNSTCFHFPKINFLPADPNATAKNTDIMLDLPWQAILDPDTGATMIITEIAAP